MRAAVALRTDVFLVGAFSSVAAAGETGAFLAGSGLASAFGAALTSAAFGAGLVFTSALGSSLAAAGLASALVVAALDVVFLVVVVVRLRVRPALRLPWSWLPSWSSTS